MVKNEAFSLIPELRDAVRDMEREIDEFVLEWMRSEGRAPSKRTEAAIVREVILSHFDEISEKNKLHSTWKNIFRMYLKDKYHIRKWPMKVDR